MSNDITTHLGAFIRIPVQYGEYETEIMSCGEHINYKGDSFCSTCGKEIKPRKLTKKSAIWFHQLMGTENLTEHIEGETMYLFSNISTCDSTIDCSWERFTNLTDDLIKTKKENFNKMFSAEIEELKQILGIEIVVEFGFVSNIY